MKLFEINYYHNEPNAFLVGDEIMIFRGWRSNGPTFGINVLRGCSKRTYLHQSNPRLFFQITFKRFSEY
jgi:hypothetical protein